METASPKDKVLCFLKGFASTFDLSGQTFMGDMIDFSAGFERDAMVLSDDWKRVENDLRKAMGQVIRGK